ncbi:MAG: inositol monophosphatase family protein [Candidatus Aminicenantales bacterium]
MKDYLDVAREAAWQAGELLRSQIDRENEVYFKGAVDLVTRSDTESQELILDYLSSHFPDHDILAEEGRSEEKRKECCWLVDPLDGTTNFAHKFPVFTVSIALEIKDRIMLGVVYDPMRKEMFWALEGKGAHLNGERIKVSSTRELDKSIVATGFPYDVRESEVNNIDNFSNFVTTVQAIRRCGSAAMDLCYVACGRFDGFWELKLKPWDVAAGSLMVKEAGGRMSDFNNNEFSIYSPQTLASNGLIHQQMVDVLSLGKNEE